MPLFIGLSGALFQHTVNNKSLSFKSMVQKKAYRLLIPFIVVTLMYSSPLKGMSGYFSSSKNVFYDVIIGQLLLQGNTHLWYLVALFLLFCLFFVLSRSRLRIGYPMLFVFALCSVFYGLMPIKMISYVMQHSLWFYLGMRFERDKSRINGALSEPRKRLLIYLFAFAGVACYFILNTCIPAPYNIVSIIPRNISIPFICLTVYIISNNLDNMK